MKVMGTKMYGLYDNNMDIVIIDILQKQFQHQGVGSSWLGSLQVPARLVGNAKCNIAKAI
jgi:hypothetical protein